MSGLSLTCLCTDFSIDNPRQVGWLSSRTLHMVPSSSNPPPDPLLTGDRQWVRGGVLEGRDKGRDRRKMGRI